MSRVNLFLEVLWDMLYAILALGSALITAFSFYKYRGTAETLWITLTLIFLVATVVFGGMFLSGRVNRKEDIHITE